MNIPQQRVSGDARQIRLVAIVLVLTMALWMLASVVGGHLGLEARFAFLFDFMALAAFAWALIVTFRIWRQRRETRAQGHGDN